MPFDALVLNYLSEHKVMQNACKRLTKTCADTYRYTEYFRVFFSDLYER